VVVLVVVVFVARGEDTDDFPLQKMLEEDSLLEKKRHWSEMVGTGVNDSVDEEFPERASPEPTLAILCICRGFPAASTGRKNNLVVDIMTKHSIETERCNNLSWTSDYVLNSTAWWTTSLCCGDVPYAIRPMETR
jgi:hypothetical protein